MNLTLGFSPCPNDTFIFYALLHQKVDTEGLSFNVKMEDVEALNQRAFRRELHLTKLSYHAYAYLWNDYILLEAGSALGNNCGPLLIAKEKLSEAAIEQATIAIPGKYTTAHFLFNLAYPKANNKKEYLFSEIEHAVSANQVDAGVIIHENRFTYQDKGLVKVQDLGEFWESKYQLPIPLGGIVAQRSLPPEVVARVNRSLKRSVAYAFEHENEVMPFVRKYAQEMEEEVMKQHINLYVNKYTLDLGNQGKHAVSRLYEVAKQKRVIQDLPQKSLFFNEEMTS